ncbi:LysM peptidoglycan-binding domain-containing protein [Labedella populi]|uniref:LysM peptidoglycan-binding domain-containing protein n=1 Tax=Labedella populi TaxID=2498850 RepID=A0A3S3ZAQ5_9MICO|nr:LysM peptidoglycan-binding domain-containing protein [Labedella populi]RWZ55414.1 LysM peptidoglycan-binding domain-containing protein [Labedella populi]
MTAASFSTASFSTVPFGTGSLGEKPASARLRITRRGRLVLATLVISPVLALGAVAGINATSAIATSDGAGSSAAVVDFEYVTINAGESLWQVAERIAPASDPRDVVADIVSLNQLGSSSVEAGQRLAIPSAYSAR